MIPSTSPASARAFVVGNFVQACCWHVPRLPHPGETLEAAQLQIEAGGKGLNVAVCLRRLGVAVEVLIACGDDQAADTLLALLAREGLPATHVHRLPGASGWGTGLIGADGQNCIAVYAGANRLLSAAHAQAASAAIESAQLVYGQFETALPAVEAAFALAHARDIPTLLNPSPWQAPPPTLRQVTHTLIVNQVEAGQLLGLPEPLPVAAADLAPALTAALPGLRARWPATRRLLLTLGRHGALGGELDDDGRWVLWHAPAPVIDAIDTVGAGDGFASGYALAVLQGQPLSTALVWGNLCGAHVAARCGVLEALPDAGQFRSLLASAARLRAVQLRS